MVEGKALSWLSRDKCVAATHRAADHELGIDSNPAATYRSMTSSRQLLLWLESVPCLWASVPDIWELDSSM